MRIFKFLNEIFEHRRMTHQTIGFVPTMGALHEGHASLIRKAKEENDQVWVSIFVNPIQFNQKEDLEKYPRPLESDLALCKQLGVSVVFTPDAEELYPNGDFYRIQESLLSHKWCGDFRPGHFSGMLTVVMKLFQIFKPDRAYFGEKDFQQLLLVQGMVKDFFLPVEIVPCETLRESDGLAMSSRNIRLTPEERRKAHFLFEVISSDRSDEQCRLDLDQAGFLVEYVETFQDRRLAAAWLGSVRLIDNVKLTANLSQVGQKPELISQEQVSRKSIHSRDFVLDEVSSNSVSVLNGKKILVKMTGSIACYKVCDLLSKLKQSGALVKVAVSESALQFVGQSTLEGLIGEKIHKDLWSDAMAHIDLMRWADLIMVAPASAHFLNQISQGSGAGLLGSMFLAHDFKKPYWIFPAMNQAMYLHPSTQASLKKIRTWGLEIFNPDQGYLACGEVGPGRLQEPLDILRKLESYFSKSAPLDQKSSCRVLITAGGTEEKIDSVRVLSNSSTGRTGVKLARALSALGVSVKLLLANRSHHLLDPTERSLYQVKGFSSSKDLKETLLTELSSGNFSGLIMAAAVSDFLPDPTDEKITSDQEISLVLKKNEKILPQVKEMHKGPLWVAGFKLTSQATEDLVYQKVSKLFKSGGVDCVVQNDSLERASADNFNLFSKDLSAQKVVGIENLALVLRDQLLDFAKTGTDSVQKNVRSDYDFMS